MSKKDLEKFKPDKLRPGRSWSTEVVGEDGYHRCHYFYRDRDGELFTTITRNHNTGEAEKKAWVKLKRIEPKKLKQLDHPDVGGDENDFKRLRSAYDEGMKIAKK